MINLSLRTQVVLIVGILITSMLSASMYVTNAISGARENIARLNKDRLASISINLAKRYETSLESLDLNQFRDSTLHKEKNLREALLRITTEELSQYPGAEAGIFFGSNGAGLNHEESIGSSLKLSNRRIEPVKQLLRTQWNATLTEQRGQWGEYKSEGLSVVVVTVPVLVRGSVVGAAWIFDDLSNELSVSWPADVTPLLLVNVVLGIVLAAYFIISLRAGMKKTQEGLDAMKQDLTVRLPESRSEFGSIARSINEFAETITRQQTEKESLQRTIQQKEKLASLGQLIAGVAHEIRTPLSAIRTRVQIWQRSMKSKRISPRSRTSVGVTPEAMQLVVTELDRVEILLKKLLYFSKERAIRKERVNIAHLLPEVIHQLEPVLQQKKITINQELQPGAVLVTGDETELAEVVVNLITNAAEAMPGGGQLTIRLTHQDHEGTCCLTFEDEGGGVDPALITQIFEPFFTTKETGTGLGLSIAYEIIRAHHGKLEYSRNSRRGATFTITLPFEKKAPGYPDMKVPV